MTKAIKITPDSKIIVVDDFQTDIDYVDNVISGYSLSLPQYWEHDKFRLTVFIVDLYDYTCQYNSIATDIFRKLYSPYGPINQVIKGFMLICNEDDDKEIPFTIEDYHYLLTHMKDIKYLQRKPIKL